MDKNVIKKYAVWARRELIERVSQRAMIYGITAKNAGDPNAESVNGHLLSQKEKRQRQALIRNIKAKGYEQVMEEVAYTWFNRFAALRFMEVNGYLPSHIRVFTNDAGEFKPQILAEAIHLELDGLDMNKVYELESANKSEELFKYLLIVQCNALNSILPGMFQRIDDYTELLLPDYLLREGSVIDRLIKDIPEDNFDVRSEDGNGQIEIIGWLYQYYISEKHEEVVDPLHGKVVKKEEVPAATQLFTTDWVVRYLIDNSVGRYWIERNPNSTLADKLDYFVKPKNGEINHINEVITPQELSTFDPCVGSGHFLVYAFDVLMEIYKEYGYSEREAAAEIVKNNLYGLDIDGRAVQLAYFAVMMKARQYDRRFFSRGIQPNVYEIIESNNIDRASVEYFTGTDAILKKDINLLLDALKDAKEYGSILRMPLVDFEKINERFIQIEGEINIYNAYLLAEFWPLIQVAEVLSGKYAVVATNPPYLNKYDAKLKAFINDNYKEHSGDLFSVFMYRNFGFCRNDGYSGFMAPFVWMFIKSYEPLRRLIIERKALTTLIQMEYSAFEEATVPICSFVFKNGHDETCALCFKLSDFKGGMEVQRIKTLEAIGNPDCGYFYEANTKDFERIPGTPISFWVSEPLYKDFANKKIQDIEPPRFGMSTSDNNRFVRIWHEVSLSKFAYPAESLELVDLSKKWYPYNNGGEFRRWYGDNGDVVNWENDGSEIKGFGRAAIRNKDFYYKSGITWTAISSAKISVRAFDYGFLFSSAGFCIFEDDLRLYILAFMNSVVGAEILRILSPTINFNVGDIARLPVKVSEKDRNTIEVLTAENINLSRSDWDSFETSWDFSYHPLLPVYADDSNYAYSLEAFYHAWEQRCESRFNQLKANEEELNRIFINIYGLQGELIPDVQEKDVTVRKADLQRDIKSLISFAVGCMFGRYNLWHAGLAYAGGRWDPSVYDRFHADKDNVIPICDDEYFEDDIVGRFIDFIRIAYGEETLEDNLKFVADALGGKGPSREVIRNYFINDFYADHLKVYQKRPIYWLFDSGKKNGFKCLVYMHRYQPDTIARIRTDYVHEQQSRYRTAIADLEQRINGASTSERVKFNKQLIMLQAQAEEIRVYEEKIHHLADQMIRIELDDGVKHNYELFKDVLAKIK
jgi:hypothetical protein